MNIAKRMILSIFLYTTFFVVPGRGGNHTVSTTIEVTQTAINRYLNTQYNAVGFQKNISVTENGINYTIALSLPEVILTAGNAKLQMVFDVWRGSINDYHFVVQPSISIPNTEITGANIEAFSTNLSSTLDSFSPALPSWVKSNILSAYNSLGWIVFPSKLTDQVNTTWFAQKSINVVTPYFSLSTEVVSGAFRFTVSTYLNSAVPVFRTYVIAVPNESDHIQFSSNIECVVRQVTILPLGSSNVIYNQTPNVTCNKGSYVDIATGNLQLGYPDVLIVKAIFTIDNTWYSRIFNYVVVNGSNEWYLASSSDN